MSKALRGLGLLCAFLLALVTGTATAAQPRMTVFEGFYNPL